MPSNTFLNLPEDKQTRLMDAASWEFSAKPFNEVSINKIIQDAGIPRGSFYMYFQDKEDLFRYLVHGYVEQLLMVLEELLLRERGDIFAALRLLFDYVWEKREEQALGGMGAMSAIISRNGGMQRGALLDLLDSGAVLERLRQSVNPELLDLRREGEHSYSFLDRDDGRRKMVYVVRSWEDVPSECVAAAAKEIKGLYVYCPEDTKGPLPEKVEAPKKSQKKEVER